MDQTLTLISWNVNGICTVAEKEAFDWLEIHHRYPLPLRDQIPENLFGDRYHHISVNSAAKKGYSGTLIASVIESTKTYT